MPIQVRQITKRPKFTRGCETCLSEISLHAPLLLQEWKLVPKEVPLI